MSILTEEEIKIIYSELFDTPEDWEMVAAIKLSGSIESAVLAKLAGMELPEPINRDDTEHEKDYYTATQLRQAYAQGAASVLSSEPAACIVEASDGANMVWPIADLDEARTYCYEEDDPVLLYTLKTIK